MLGALFLSNTGTFLQFAAQAWWAWAHTQSPGFLGLLALAQAVPLLGVPLLGGMLADRFPRRRLLLATQAALAAVAAGLGGLALTDQLTPPLLLAGAGGLAVVAALDNPVRQVYLPGVVPPERRARVVGLNALAYNLGAVVGPGAAGVLIPVVGVGPCLVLNAASYLLVWGWLLGGPPGRPAAGAPAAGGGGWGVGLDRAGTLRLLGIVAAVSLLGRSYPHVLPALAARLWGAGVGTYGTLAAVPGAGALVAAAVVTWGLGREQVARCGWLGGVLLGGALVGLSFTRTVGPAGAALLLVGFAATGTMTLLNARLQLITPDGSRGRVLSLYTWVAAGAPAFGGWLLGGLLNALPPASLLFLLGAVLTSVVLLLHRRERPRSPPPSAADRDAGDAGPREPTAGMEVS